jgi:hypothetical protein
MTHIGAPWQNETTQELHAVAHLMQVGFAAM